MLWLYKLPYKVGLVTAVTFGLVSIPLVFHLEFACWFNDTFVTFEHYGEGEADTWLETGSWTWNWMEPVSWCGKKREKEKKREEKGGKEKNFPRPPRDDTSRGNTSNPDLAIQPMALSTYSARFLASF